MPETTPHTDIKAEGFIARLPEALRPYALLARLDRPAGFMLLFFPCVFALVLATPAGSLPSGLTFILFLLGAIIMRAGGCAVNDVIDKDLDRDVVRTALRPVASGQLSSRQALIFAALCTGMGFLIVLSMGWPAVLFSALAIPLILAYPFMKRITWWPQAFLGLTFNWGVLVGFAAVTGSIPLAALILYAACFFWTLGYDTIYAFQDKDDDERVGIKSTARLLGLTSKKWVGFWYGLFFLLLLAAGAAAKTGWLFYIASGAVMVQLFAQLKNWRMEDAESAHNVFRSNIVTGWVVLAALLLGHMTK